jgi:type II restriction/modification system DNA methylase subunit YeeA
VNTSQLKTYAPEARRNFLAAVRAQAARLGITKEGILPAEVQGEVLLIGGQALPAAWEQPRARLAARVESEGLGVTLEAIAYTWFNRLVALRYMELHGYLDHGYRVLSHPEGGDQPEILEHAAEVDLPGLDQEQVIEWKLDGTRDEELYRRLILAQCNALHRCLPMLFERIGDETELLLPANLLHSDSLIRQLVEGVDEEAWEQIEVVGWLYQFYISEKKDQVIGKVVATEDIPAATQLFTPNWIVKYLVENSLGAQWMATYPRSSLKTKMDYFIEPAEQTEQVQAQLKTLTPESLDPEALRLIDPACGSGHILVEAYDLFKAIYLERGYRQREIPKLILEKNLFGLDIDPRAAQLTSFALIMKGRADDRRLFTRDVRLNVLALKDGKNFDPAALNQGVDLACFGLAMGDLVELKQLFEHAGTFGSLIQIPKELTGKLPTLRRLCQAHPPPRTNAFVQELDRLEPLLSQAELLAGQYDAVVANPPYMGGKGMNPRMKKFAKDHFPDAKSDLFACFIERGYSLAKHVGHNAMVTMQSWMFLSSYQKMRERMLAEKTITTMAHLGARAFGSISGEVVQTTACVLRNSEPKSYRPAFFRLLDGGEETKRTALQQGDHRFDRTAQDEFKKIPGSPVAYWVSDFAVFDGAPLNTFAASGGRTKTHNDERFVRTVWEVSNTSCGPGRKWMPFEKGGAFRRWFGERTFLVDWSDIAKTIYAEKGGLRNEKYRNREGVTWSDITSGPNSFRLKSPSSEYSSSSPTIFLDNTESVPEVLSLLNSKPFGWFLRILNPTLHVNPGDALCVPTVPLRKIPVRKIPGMVGTRCVSLSRSDWNAYERSWDFTTLPLLTASTEPTPTLATSYQAWIATNQQTIAEMQRLEEENNRLFIDAYGLSEELTPEVPIEQITLTVNPAYRYGVKGTEEERQTRFREDTMKELISYAIGCMMGRYSLDEPGLIYAHAGNIDFDPTRYQTFPADEDGIVPLTDPSWFEDDACNRVIEFLSVAWSPEYLEENLEFLAENLSPKKSESSRETLRRYLCDKFFKDHLQSYKKRPIYWLFTSGKKKAFQCLVYLHRYHQGTLARIRSSYVIPLQGKMATRLEQLQGDIEAATSTAHRKRLEKEETRLKGQQVELIAFDERLRHHADRRIALDLDDGVKVNYGKFGNGLLAEVKAVHGKKVVEP